MSDVHIKPFVMTAIGADLLLKDGSAQAECSLNQLYGNITGHVQVGGFVLGGRVAIADNGVSALMLTLDEHKTGLVLTASLKYLAATQTATGNGSLQLAFGGAASLDMTVSANSPSKPA